MNYGAKRLHYYRNKRRIRHTYGKISGETLFIALALLPPGSDIGTKLHYEMLEYTIVE